MPDQKPDGSNIPVCGCIKSGIECIPESSSESPLFMFLTRHRMVVPQKQCTQSRTQRQCIQGRNQYRNGKGKCKLPVKYTCRSLHKSNRDKYRSHDQCNRYDRSGYFAHGLHGGIPGLSPVRSIFECAASTTTIASSTTIPMASTSANRVSRLMVNPKSCIKKKVPMMATGTAIAGINVDLKS